MVGITLNSILSTPSRAGDTARPRLVFLIKECMHMKIQFLRRTGALLLSLALLSSLLILPAAADDPVLSLSASPSQIRAGETSTVTLTGAPSGAAVSWSSSNPQAASVPSGASGETCTVTAGTVPADVQVTITATVITPNDDDPGNPHTYTAQCTITVSAPPAVSVTDISLDKSELTLSVGETATLTATLLPNNATDKTITWRSSKESVASFSGISNGSSTTDSTVTITALSPGSTMFSAFANGKIATCTVTVTPRALPIEKISLDPKEAYVRLGSSATITAKTEPSNATDTTITWQFTTPNPNFTLTSNGLSAVVSPRGNAKAGDSVAVIAVAKNQSTTQREVHSDPCIVYAVAAQLPQITHVDITSPDNDAYKYVDPGKTFQLSAQAYPVEASESERRIIWQSEDSSIATVDPNGVVTGVSPGETTIYAISASDSTIRASRLVEVSGILLSYRQPSGTSGSQGTEINLTPSYTVDIFQYRDISVTTRTFGNAKLKTINWESTNPTVAQVVTGRVTGNYPGDNVTITASVASTGYSASFKVRVSEDVAQAITVSMGSNPSYSFSNLLSSLNSRSQTKAGASLDNVYNLKVSTKNGILYYRYTSSNSPGHGVGGTERYYYSPSGQGQMSLGDITFVPTAGFSDTAVVDYNAVATNGTTFTGTIRIEATATGDVSYSTEMDQPVTFSAEHFSAVCKGRTGQAIRYITFDQPAASRGTLYQDYSSSGLYSPRVSSSTRYYVTSRPSINQVTFVPAAGFVGEAEITYRCTDSTGASFTGKITITVSSASGGRSSNVEYSTALNQRRDLNGSDFNDASQRATNANLDYIRFDSLPSSGVGTLYLNYSSSSSTGTRVTTGRSYYRNSTPRISNITFVPASGYSGTVSIPFTGTNTSGTTFTGSLIIHVGDGTGTVHYNTSRNQAVTFRASDFNDACRSATGTSLNYVRFTSLPSSSVGTLYSGYSSASSTGSRVSTGTDYRRTGSPSLSNVTFAPASGYTGTASIPFTGYDDNGSRFNGTVTIRVGGSGQIISYTASANSAVRFSSSDFNNACRSATGDSLNYVRFDTASTAYGSLYYQYNTASRTGTSVSTGYGYYYSGGNRLLSDISFASNSTAGTASIGYTGYSSRGDSFSGTVEVRVNAAASPAFTGIHYTGSSTPIALRASDFQNACQAALGTSLSSVQFSTLPAAGRLYQNYSGPGRTGTGVNTAARYGVQDLDQISYLPKAEYQGQINIPYTAYDVQGGSHTGTVEIQLSNSYCSTSFSDVASGWDWAKPSIEFLRQSGITTGYGNGTFRPGQQISRGEFTLMICRAFQFPTSGNSDFPDVPAGSVYAGAIASARDLGIVQGNNGLFQPDRPITRQSAMTMICRAMDAAGQAVPTASTGLLSGYDDGGQVSAHARASVAALIQLGAVRGTRDMRINPTAPISRAEMAVILHRVLTQ